MSRAHALISPSGAERIARCPGSVNATKDLPRRANEAAALGTVDHEVTADCLITGFDADDFLNDEREADGFKFKIDDEHVDTIQPVLDWAREQPGLMYVETRVDLRRWPPFEFGTLDLGFITPEIITLVDHKYGYVPVEAESNKQIAIYAVGFWRQIARHVTKATKFRLIINQPRRVGPKWREWIVELDELLEFMGDIQESVSRALDPDAPRIPGKVQCQYCASNPAMGGPGCDALDAYMLSLLGLTHDDLDESAMLGVPLQMPDLSSLTPEQLGEIVEHRSMLKNWVDGVAKTAAEKARAGLVIPGRKLVKSFGDREYKDPAAAEAILIGALGREESFTTKLKSPAQAEKVMKPTKRKPGHPEAWVELSKLIDRPERELELVPLSDEREAFVPNEDRFDEEDVE